ncbi:hypothetical protein [Breoghania sp.]|uniref:hypothetical protein n=1 Tax=Breoghania sp. TaxID=2065378 RepID=UPI002601BF77|nr:hypothetical protein [Breoghania sp.]MDJ0930790.1 hypothetical protein [Breoghania sp.]
MTMKRKIDDDDGRNPGTGDCAVVGQNLHGYRLRRGGNGQTGHEGSLQGGQPGFGADLTYAHEHDEKC